MKDVVLPPFRPRKVSKRDIFRRFCDGAEGVGLVKLSIMLIEVDRAVPGTIEGVECTRGESTYASEHMNRFVSWESDDSVNDSPKPEPRSECCGEL